MEDTDLTRHWSHVLKSSDDVIHNQSEKEYFSETGVYPVKMSLLPNNSVLSSSQSSPQMTSVKRGSVSLGPNVSVDPVTRFNANHETLLHMPSINSLYHPSIRHMSSFPEELWRSNESRKISAMLLVYCLRLQVDPPDIPRPVGCARIFQWVDTQGFSDPAVSGSQIADTLTHGFTQLRSDLPKSILLDPTKSQILQASKDIRKMFHSDKDRLLFYYSGHGVPKPTRNGEVWVYDQTYTQYVPLSLKETAMALSSPLPQQYIHDGPAAGIAVDAWKQLVKAQPAFDLLTLASSNSEDMALDPRYPVDIFTCCLLHPVRVALLYHYNDKYPLKTHGDTLHTPRGSSAEHATVTQGFHVPPLSVLDQPKIQELELLQKAKSSVSAPFVNLEWQQLCILDAIAWSTLPPAQFQNLFRKEPTVATMFRNFLVAQRVLKSIGNTPISVPALPDFTKHFLWQRWDTILAEQFTKLSLFLCKYLVPPGINFFQVQFTAQQQAQTEPDQKRPPLELPMLVQILLLPTSYRTTALQLLCKYIDNCTGNIVVAQTTGVLPYLRKLLEFDNNDSIEEAKKQRNCLIFLSTKIMAVDASYAVKTGNKKTFQVVQKHLAQYQPQSIALPIAMPVGMKRLHMTDLKDDLETDLVYIEPPVKAPYGNVMELKPLEILPLHQSKKRMCEPVSLSQSILQEHAPHMSSRDVAAMQSLGEAKLDNDVSLFKLQNNNTNTAFKTLSKFEHDEYNRHITMDVVPDTTIPRLECPIVQQAATLCSLIQFAQAAEPIHVALLLTSVSLNPPTQEYSMTLRNLDGVLRTTQVSLQHTDVTTLHALQNHTFLPKQAVPVSLLSLPYSNTLLRALKKLNTSQQFFPESMDFSPQVGGCPTPISANKEMHSFHLDVSPYIRPFEPLASPTLDLVSPSPIEPLPTSANNNATNNIQTSTLPLLEILGKYLTSTHSDIRRLTCVLLGSLADGSYASQNCLLLSNIHLVLISMLCPYFSIDRVEHGVLPSVLPSLHAYNTSNTNSYNYNEEQSHMSHMSINSISPHDLNGNAATATHNNNASNNNNTSNNNSMSNIPLMVRSYRLYGSVEEHPDVRTAAAYALQCLLSQFHAPPPTQPNTLHSNNNMQTPTNQSSSMMNTTNSGRKTKGNIPTTPHRKKEKKSVTSPCIPEQERTYELLLIAYNQSYSAYDACGAVRQEVAIGLGHVTYELQDIFVKCALQNSNTSNTNNANVSKTHSSNINTPETQPSENKNTTNIPMLADSNMTTKTTHTIPPSDYEVPLHTARSEEFFVKSIWNILLYLCKDANVTVAYIAENICVYIRNLLNVAKENEMAIQSVTNTPAALRLDTGAGLKQFDRLRHFDRLKQARAAQLKAGTNNNVSATLLTSSSTSIANNSNMNNSITTSPGIVQLQVNTSAPTIILRKERLHDKLWNNCVSPVPNNILQMLKYPWLDHSLNIHDICQLGTLPPNIAVATYERKKQDKPQEQKQNELVMRARYIDTANTAYTYHLNSIKREHMYAFAHASNTNNHAHNTHKTACGKAHAHVCSGEYDVIDIQEQQMFPSLMNQACLYNFGRSMGTMISKHSIICKSRIRLWITVIHNAIIKHFAASPIHLHVLLQPVEIGKDTFNFHGSELFLVGLGSVVPEILACVAAISQLLYLAIKCKGSGHNFDASIRYHIKYLQMYHSNDAIARLYNSNATLLQHAYDVYSQIHGQDHYGVKLTSNQIPCQFQTSRPESITDTLITMTLQDDYTNQFEKMEAAKCDHTSLNSVEDKENCIKCMSLEQRTVDGMPIIVIRDYIQEKKNMAKFTTAHVNTKANQDEDEDMSQFYPEKPECAPCMGTDRLCSRCDSSEELIELLSTQASCSCLCSCDCSCNSNSTTIPNSYTSIEEASAVVDFSIEQRHNYDFACCITHMREYFPNETRSIADHPLLLAYNDPTSMFARNPVLNTTLSDFLSEQLITNSNILTHTNDDMLKQIPCQWDDGNARKIVPSKAKITNAQKPLSFILSHIWKKDRAMLISSQIGKWVQACYGDGTVCTSEQKTTLQHMVKRCLRNQYTGFSVLPRPVTPRQVVFKTGLSRRTPRIPLEIMWSHKDTNVISAKEIAKMTEIHAITTSSMLAMKKRHPAEYTYSPDLPEVEETDLKPIFVEATQLAYSSRMKEVSSVYLHPYDSIVVLGGEQGLIQICDYNHSFVRTPGAQPEKAKWTDVNVRTTAPVVYVSGMNECTDSGTIIAATDDRYIHIVKKDANNQYETVASFLAHPSLKSIGNVPGIIESFSGNVRRRALAATNDNMPNPTKEWDYLIPIAQRSRSLQKPITLNGNPNDSLTGANVLEEFHKMQEKQDDWTLFGQWNFSQLTQQLQLQSHIHSLPRGVHEDVFNISLNQHNHNFIQNTVDDALFSMSSPRLSAQNITKAQSLSGFSLPSPVLKPLKQGETKYMDHNNASNNNTSHNIAINIAIANPPASKSNGMDTFIQQMTSTSNNTQMSGIELPVGSHTPEDTLKQLPTPESLIPNSKLQCHWGRDNGYLIASVDFTKVWDMERLQCIADLPQYPYTHTDKGSAFTYANNTQPLYSTTLTASASGHVIFNGLSNGYISIVDARIRPKNCLLTCFSTHTDPVVHATCVPTVHEYDLFTVGESGVCNVLDARVLFQTTELPYNLITPPPKPIYSTDEWYEDFTTVCDAYNPMEPLSRCYFRKTHTSKPLVRTAKYEPQVIPDEILPVTTATVHPLTKWVATGSTGSFVDIFHINGASIQTVKYHASFMSQRIEPVKSLLFHPLKPYLFSLASSSLTVYVANKYPVAQQDQPNK